MACKVRNERLSAIYDTVIALTRENPNIETLQDVKDWFAQNRPEVGADEIVDSLVATSPDKISEARKNLIKRRSDIRAQARLIDRLNDLMDGVQPIAKKNTIAPNREVRELDKLIKDLYKTVKNDSTMSNQEWLEVTSRLGQIQQFHQKYYDGSGQVSRDAIERALDTVEKIKTLLKIGSLDKRIDSLDKRIESLQGDEIDASALLDPDANVVFKPLDKRILEKEAELQDLKMAFEQKLRKIKIKEIAAKEGILGFKTPRAIKTREFFEVFKREAWEAPRSLAFMADASAWGVQLAPIVMSETAGLNLKELAKGNFRNAFASQREMARIFNEGTIQIFKDDISNIDSLKRSRGLWAKKMLKDIKTDPLYPLMKKSGLKISESRSLSKSEEVYTSDVLNRWPVAGFVKDISEDTMVTTLNLYRQLLFRQFYQMNPTVPLDQFEKAAEFINELTGTSNVRTGPLSYLMSAPRLLVSRLRLAFLRPFTLAARLDVSKSLREKGLRYQSAADQFIAQRIFKMWKGYALWFGLMALIPGIEFGDDWEESDWLRIRVGDTSLDFTGGMGALARMAAKMMLMLNGPPDDASYLAQRRADFYRGAKGEGLIDAGITTLVKYRMHPTFTAMASVAEGKDFFGQPYHEIFGPGHVGSRMEALLRASLPISVETMLDQFGFTPNSGMTEDSMLSIIQFFGVNTFEYSDKSQDLRAVDFFNKIEHKPDTVYPSKLSLSKNELDPRLAALRAKYKQEFGDMMGTIVIENPDMTKREFQGKVKRANRKLQQEFLEEYKDSIVKLVPKSK